MWRFLCWQTTGKLIALPLAHARGVQLKSDCWTKLSDTDQTENWLLNIIFQFQSKLRNNIVSFHFDCQCLLQTHILALWSCQEREAYIAWTLHSDPAWHCTCLSVTLILFVISLPSKGHRESRLHEPWISLRCHVTCYILYTLCLHKSCGLVLRLLIYTLDAPPTHRLPALCWLLHSVAASQVQGNRKSSNKLHPLVNYDI